MAVPSEIAELVKPYTKSTLERMASMYDALKVVDDRGVMGAIVECGVWRGGNIMLARLVSPNRWCWLYDTFDGMTEPDHELDRKRNNAGGQPGELAIDRYHLKKQGGTKWDAIDIETVKSDFKTLGIEKRCTWIVGPIEETIHSFKPEHIAVLRLDMDWHWPTKVALEHLYPVLSKGGFLIVDDYGHWMGCKKAVDDYFGNERPPMKQVDYSCVVFQKC